ncbi:collagen-like protein [Cognatitamlana onchidii]|uniref:collagen-like protein n=1 Tax=Cognatitamlana onchidii TaxID=2562860 RepID=UPI00196A798D|nr:collagen-like protein [Algibacter onchidii]
MKTLLSKMKYLALALVVVLAFSCSAEDGAPGEQGPQGVQGPQGPQGEKGEKGDPGDSGSGSVKTVLFEDQLLQSGETGVIEFNVPQLTQDIFDNGLVYAYISESENNSSWSPLPFSLLEEVSTPTGTTVTSTIVVEILTIEVGKVSLFYLLNDASWDVKFVLVPGAAAEASSFDINDFL